MSKKKLKDLLDEFHYHELLDRTHMITVIIDTHLLQHPVCKVHKNIRDKIDSALNSLCEAYQEITSETIEKEKNLD